MSRIFHKPRPIHSLEHQRRSVFPKRVENLTTVLDSMDELVFVLDQGGRITHFPQRNKAGDLFVSPNSFLGKRIDQLGFPADVQADFIAKIAAAKETGAAQTCVYEIPTPKGKKPFEARISVRANTFGQIIGFTVIARDISERKEAEERFQACGMRYQTLVENMPAMVCRFDPEGYLIFANDHFSRCHLTNNFFQQLPPEARLDFTAKRLSLSPDNRSIVLKYGVADGNGSVRWFRWRINAFFSSHGELQEFQGFGEDLTEDNARALQQEQLGRLQTSRRLAQTIVHEVNNALTGIGGFLGFALETAQELGADSLTSDLSEVKASAAKIERLTQQLASIYKANSCSLVVANPAELARKSVESFFYGVNQTKQIVWTEETTPPAMIDITQFNQVMEILLRNALEAIPDSGRIEVKAKPVKLEQESPSHFAMIPPGEYAMISVTDNGRGIDPKKLHLIFDPTYTTKNQGGTSGLSLTQLQSIIEKHNAFVKVESLLGKGTTFSLFFPTTKEIEKISVPPVSQRRPGPVTVLIVDDEPTIREICERVLSGHGHNVTVAKNGEEALTLLANNGPFQLVITDINMGPGLSGIELAQQINQRYAGTRIAVMSGNHEEMEKAGSLVAIHGSIKKPFPNEKILSLLEKALGD